MVMGRARVGRNEASVKGPARSRGNEPDPEKKAHFLAHLFIEIVAGDEGESNVYVIEVI